MIPKKKSNDSPKSITTTNYYSHIVTNRKKEIVILYATMCISLSIVAGIGFTEIFVHGYSSAADLNKGSLCTTKVLDMSQKGIIRDTGGFSGAVYECIHMTSHDSIYDNVLSARQG